MIVSSIVSASCAWSRGPRIRTSGSCGKTTVPSGMASTSPAKRNCREAVEEGRLEQRAAIGVPQGRQVRQVLRRVAERVEDLDRVGQPGHDRVAAVERPRPEGQIEDGLAVGDPGIDVAGGHRQLVEVGERRQGRAIDVADVRHGHLPYACPASGLVGRMLRRWVLGAPGT